MSVDYPYQPAPYVAPMEITPVLPASFVGQIMSVNLPVKPLAPAANGTLNVHLVIVSV